MNSSNVTSLPNFDLINAYDFVNNIGYVYMVTAVCSIGVTLNSFCLLVFFKPDFEASVYLYFRFKTIAEIILTGAGALNAIYSCSKCPLSQTFFAQFYSWMGLVLCTSSSYTFIAFMDTLILYDRFKMIHLENNLTSKLKVKIKSAVCLVISIATALPSALSLEIKSPANNDQFQLSTSSFGNSRFFFYYQIVYILSRSALFVVFHFIFITLLILKFKRFIRNKIGIVPSSAHVVQRLYEKEKRLISIVISLACLFLTSRMFQSISIVYNLYLRFANQNNPFSVYFYYATLLFTYVTASVNFFIHLKFNATFVTHSKKIFQKLTFKD
jgi:hypothetical protein